MTCWFHVAWFSCVRVLDSLRLVETDKNFNSLFGDGTSTEIDMFCLEVFNFGRNVSTGEKI